MSPIDAAILRRKMQHIAVCLDHLRPIGRLAPSEYAAANRLLERKAAERLLQQAIEAALDINAHMIAELGGDLPADYYGGFVAMGRLGAIEVELAAELAPSAGLRNRLVHEYEGIDDDKVHSAIETILRLYPRYVSAIDAYLTRHAL